MKIYIIIFLSALFISTGIISTRTYADPPMNPPPPPGPGHGQGGNPPSGAPIDGGLGILLVCGAAFGGWKYRKEAGSLRRNG